jgi:hypothetical protein
MNEAVMVLRVAGAVARSACGQGGILDRHGRLLSMGEPDSTIPGSALVLGVCPLYRSRRKVGASLAAA